MFFSSVTLTNWRQFDRVEIDLSSQVTILTGSNGCGKTTILTLLSRYFGWDIHYVSSPYVSKRATKRLFKDVWDQYDEDYGAEPPQEVVTIGSVGFSDGGRSELRVPRLLGANYNVDIQQMRHLKGLFIPSHRQQSVYNPVTQIPTNPVTAAQMYEQYKSLANQLYQSGARQQKTRERYKRRR